MKKMSLIASLAAAIAVAFLLTGCGKAPQKEVEAAKAAVENAKVANAERFAADLYKAAKDSLDAAITEIETQNTKKLIRSYNKALSLLKATMKTAKAAQETAITNAVQAKIEAQKLLKTTSVSVGELRKLVKDNAKKIKDKASLKALETDVKFFEKSLANASDELETDLVAASDKIRSIVEKVAADKEKVTALTAKKADKKKKK